MKQALLPSHVLGLPIEYTSGDLKIKRMIAASQVAAALDAIREECRDALGVASYEHDEEERADLGNIAYEARQIVLEHAREYGAAVVLGRAHRLRTFWRCQANPHIHDLRCAVSRQLYERAVHLLDEAMPTREEFAMLMRESTLREAGERIR